jgi:hypothetical protein
MTVLASSIAMIAAIKLPNSYQMLRAKAATEAPTTGSSPLQPEDEYLLQNFCRCSKRQQSTQLLVVASKAASLMRPACSPNFVGSPEA